MASLLSEEINNLRAAVLNVQQLDKKDTSTRTCSKCGRTKTLDDFYFIEARGRHLSRCKSCHREIVYSSRKNGCSNKMAIRRAA